MSIYKYEIIAPVKDYKKPYIDNKGYFVIPNIAKYNYYIECARYNLNTATYEYFILFSNTKFNPNCRKCISNNYSKNKLILHGRFKDYVTKECNARGNVNCEYMETESEYDVYRIE